MGSEYEKYGLAKGLATAVFLYSFSGGERRGVNLPWLRVALLREGIPPTIVGDAVSKLEDALWYFHTEKRFYSFKNQPNLNRIIVDKEEATDPEQVRESLYEHLNRLARGASFDVYLWPKASGDIPDSRRLKLILLDPEQKYGESATATFIREILDSSGSTFRIYRNTVFAVAMDAGSYAALERQLRRFLALQEIAGDATISLTAADREELQTKLNQSRKDLPYAIVAVYRHVSWRSNGDVVWRDMGIPTVGENPSISARVWRYLKDEERILSSLTPKVILDRAFGKEETEKTLNEIFDVFLKTPGLPCLESEKVLLDAASQGAKAGLLGVRLGSALYFGETPPDLTLDAVVVRPEKAEEEKKAGSEIPGGGGGSPGGRGGGTGSGDGDQGIQTIQEERESYGVQNDGQVVSVGAGDPGQPAAAKVRRVSIKAAVPWDKLSQIVAGVIRPLKASGGEPKIIIEVKAESESGFDRTTLDSKVKETLQQVGAVIAEWEESCF